MVRNSDKDDPARRKCKAKGIVLALLLLLVLLVSLYLARLDRQRRLETRAGGVDTSQQLLGRDTTADSADDIPDSADTSGTGRPEGVARKCSTAVSQARDVRGTIREGVAQKDSTATDTRTDSAVVPDSMNGLPALMESDDPCATDTLAPWVYPDPSGGLHRGEVPVRFATTESCVVEWRLSEEDEWHWYTGTAISITKNAALRYRAHDRCGNTMSERTELYEIATPQDVSGCPEGMGHIEVGGMDFCIDRYEWPNRKGERPFAYISVYHAMDSCFAAGKRLCTSEEWSIACAGAYSWQYPYGDVYEPHACVTRDTTANRSGSRPECRGYFNVYDMSGNLAEWTSTRSRKNPKFHDVMGGFWESGPQSSCYAPRYSYYPRNRHNPVGFRCCKDVE